MDQFCGHCQTVALNNFIGDDVVTPQLLIDKLDLWPQLLPGYRTISSDLTIGGHLELFARWCHELQQSRDSLVALENRPLLPIVQKVAAEIDTLPADLECASCSIVAQNAQKVRTFCEAAEESGINRLILSYGVPGYWHVIALRREL